MRILADVLDKADYLASYQCLFMPWMSNYNDRAMIRWVCGVTTKDQNSSQDLLDWMQLDDQTKVLRTRRLRWHGHVECSDGWLKTVQKTNPTGGRVRDRFKKTWTEVTDMDRLARV